MQTRRTLAAALAALCLVAPGGARADYPDRPLNLVVPFPPGGTADTLARALQPALQKVLQQPVVVVNRPGAGGAIGVGQVANAPADGYTLLCSLLSVASLPEQALVNRQKPPFTLDQLTPVALLSAEPVALVVPEASPYRALPDLLAAARARPNGLTYGSTGFFGEVHVRTEAFTDVAGLQARHIPYQGGAPLVTALLAKEVDFAILSRSLSAAQVKAGRLRYLASAGDEPWTDPPGVPRMKDQGVDFDAVAGTAVFMRAGTPAAVEQKVRQAVHQAAHDPEFRQAVANAGAVVQYSEGADFARFWAGYVKAISATTRKIALSENAAAGR